MVNKVFVADFETTVYSGQKKTEVWAAALVELNTENVIIDTSIWILSKKEGVGHHELHNQR